MNGIRFSTAIDRFRTRPILMPHAEEGKRAHLTVGLESPIYFYLRRASFQARGARFSSEPYKDVQSRSYSDPQPQWTAIARRVSAFGDCLCAHRIQAVSGYGDRQRVDG